jgi:hypothetical protein
MSSWRVWLAAKTTADVTGVLSYRVQPTANVIICAMCQSDNSIPQAPANPNTPQSPCQRRGFLFIQYPTKTPNSVANTWHHCHQRSLTKAPSRHRALHRKQSGHTKPSPITFLPTSTHILSTHSPNTTFSVAITNAIGSPKSHCHLMPLVRDLIEPDIKRKG